MNKFLMVSFLGLTLLVQPVSASNPFSQQTVEINAHSDSSTLTPLTQDFLDSNEQLKRAFELLAATRLKFQALLRDISQNPGKYAKNGSMREISAKITELHNKLNASSQKLLQKYNSLPPSDRFPLPSVITTPRPLPAPVPANPVVSGNAPAPEPRNVSGQITCKSPGFREWFNNGLNISQAWNFPDVTNMYGEKITRENFLKAIMFIESGGVHKRSNGQTVTSSAGALGFMQLMPRTARGLGVNPNDPRQNIAGGAKYFNNVFNGGKVGRKTGIDKLIMAGCAYNMGPYSRRLDQSLDSFVRDTRSPRETRRYAIKLKMCLGLRLTAGEETVARQLRMTGSKSIEQYALDCFRKSRGIGM